MAIMIIGSNYIYFESLPSTNTYTAQLLKKEKLPEGTIVCSNFQSAGKGQQGNIWESEDEKNLLISVLLFPSILDTARQFFISMSISLALCDFLKRYINGITIKWPNDIYINNDKIAGILIENSIMGKKIESSIVGIGLNINQNKFLSKAPNPVSLSLLTGLQFDLGICLNQLAFDLDKRYKQLISEELTQIKLEYTSLLYRIDEWYNYSDSSGTFTGRIISVSENGMLKIERKSGNISEYSFKEVEFIP